ncbi:MAG: DUF63 family protein [Candidatus Micrarchaeia archaeon]
MSLQSFVTEYFVNPICFQSQHAPYNVYNTATYAVLALLAAYVIYLTIKKIGIRPKKNFFLAIVPFVVLGSTLRVFEDAQILPRCVEFLGFQNVPTLFMSPGIYILTFSILVASFSLARIVQKKDVEKTLGSTKDTGTVIAILTMLVYLSKVGVKNAFFAVATIAITLTAYYAFKYSWKKLAKNGFDVFAKGAFFGQVFDGSATFIGTTFAGYGEQHVVGNLIIDFFGGSWAFLLVKIAFAIAVVWIAKTEFSPDEQDQRAYVLILIMVMGLAPGLRDVLRIMAGV